MNYRSSLFYKAVNTIEPNWKKYMSLQLATEELNFECVLLDSSCTPPLFLESDLGENKANYWSDDINKAKVFYSVSEALPVFNRVSYKGNVEIKKIVKKVTEFSLKIGRHEYVVSENDVFSDNGVRVLFITQNKSNDDHLKLPEKAQKIINKYERIPLDGDWFKLKIT